MLSKYLNEWWFEWNINEKKKLYEWMSFGFQKKCIKFKYGINTRSYNVWSLTGMTISYLSLVGIDVRLSS
jgi:hypothetical protein